MTPIVTPDAPQGDGAERGSTHSLTDVPQGRTEDQEWVVKMFKERGIVGADWEIGDGVLFKRGLPQAAELRARCRRAGIPVTRPTVSQRMRTRADGQSLYVSEKALTKQELMNELVRWVFRPDQLGRAESWTPINRRPLATNDIRRYFVRKTLNPK